MAFGVRSVGGRRLRLLLAILAPLTLLGAFAVVFAAKGGPYWPGWWFVAAGLVFAAAPAGALLAGVIEWVIAGYRADLDVSPSPSKTA